MNGRPVATRSIATYARVSSDEQAERQSIQGQIDFLRQFASLYDLTIAGEYLDDGVSGAIALNRRPGGAALLEAIKAGVCSEVIVYRLDRLGRSLRVLLDAHAELETAGVTLRSATEPFDTAQPIGRFIFNLLGSMAELERSTISERTTMGRDRVTRNGVWTGGWVPWGYVKSDSGQLAPDDKILAPLGIPVSAAVRELYERIAGGSTAAAEARRLSALGVVPVATTARGGTLVRSPRWTVAKVCAVLGNPLYRGVLTLRSRHGTVEASCPALVPPALWYAAVAQLAANRTWSKRPARSPYLLRRLIRCAHCGSNYIGATTRGYRYYYCRRSKLANLTPAERCQARMVRADHLEAEVWDGVRERVMRPSALPPEHSEPLDTDDRARRTTLERAIAAKDAEVQRILGVLRAGHVTTAQAAPQLDAIAAETRTLRELLAALDAQAAVAEAEAARVADLPATLARLRATLPEQEGDPNYQMEVIGFLVRRITVTTAADARGRVRAVADVEWTV